MLYQDACVWLADWIVQHKRSVRPDSLYVAGVSGSIGRGKSTFCALLADLLNQRLKPTEGKALVRSLDDYYLPKAVRYAPEFLALGYNPPGIPNRGPAGTHDLEKLQSDLRNLENSSEESVLDLPVFDKQSDDRAGRPLRLQGKTGILLLEGWFVGARSEADPEKLPDGLKRSVARSLRRYQIVFDRLDALVAFEPLSITEIIRDRREQQRSLDQQSGRPGMTPEQIEQFVRYFYVESWHSPETCPDPLPLRVTFWATMDSHRQSIEFRPGPKTS